MSALMGLGLTLGGQHGDGTAAQFRSVHTNDESGFQLSPSPSTGVAYGSQLPGHSSDPPSIILAPPTCLSRAVRSTPFSSSAAWPLLGRMMRT